MVSFRGAHVAQDISPTCVRWSVASPLSYRHGGELTEERGVSVDHATAHRWVLKYSPQLAAVSHRGQRPVGISWRLDETYLKVAGQWRYLHRAVDKAGQTMGFLLTAQRDARAAVRFLAAALRRHGVPETVTIDGSGAKAAAVRGDNTAHGTATIIRQVKYLNNVAEQGHRAVKRTTPSMLGFKASDAAQYTLTGSELMPMVRKGPRAGGAEEGLTAAEQFYALAA